MLPTTVSDWNLVASIVASVEKRKCHSSSLFVPIFLFENRGRTLSYCLLNNHHVGQMLGRNAFVSELTKSRQAWHVTAASMSSTGVSGLEPGGWRQERGRHQDAKLDCVSFPSRSLKIGGEDFGGRGEGGRHAEPTD